MTKIKDLIESNVNWSNSIKQKDPNFFIELAKKQHPKYLWIGCSDSRVPTNTLLGSSPGEVFVHRNIANMVLTQDINCTAVIEFAVNHLKVSDIIVAGHYGCGGIKSALTSKADGNLGIWLDSITKVSIKHKKLLKSKTSDEAVTLLCMLNAIEQAVNLCNLDTLQQAWKCQQNITVHCWIYNIASGLIEDTLFKVSASNQLTAVYEQAIKFCKNKNFSDSIYPEN